MRGGGGRRRHGECRRYGASRSSSRKQPALSSALHRKNQTLASELAPFCLYFKLRPEAYWNQAAHSATYCIVAITLEQAKTASEH